MLIGLDARMIVDREITGVGSLVLAIHRKLTLLELPHVLFVDRTPTIELSNSWTRIASQGPRNRFFWEQRTLPFLLRKFPVDLWHATWNHGIPLRYSRKTVLTLHDLIPFFHHPGTLIERLYDLGYRWSILHSVKKASHIVTVSRSSCKVILDRFPFVQDKITVIPNGYSEAFFTVPDSEERRRVLEQYRVSSPYFIYHGGFHSRKNVDTLIRAVVSFNAIPGQERLHLVICGAINDYGKHIGHLVHHYSGEGYIQLIGFVPTHDLRSLLSASLASLYLSSDEGFGLPVVEAMACGIPVIVSDIPVIREVGDDAVIYVEPASISSIMSAIRRIRNDSKLRFQKIQEGYERVQHFTNKQMTDRYVALYAELINLR